MKLKYFIMLFVFLISVNLSGKETLNIYDQKVLRINNELYVELNFSINDEGYIYGNPKGPGTGKETIVEIKSDSKNIKKIYFSNPEKYFPDSSTEWVFRYNNNFKILFYNEAESYNIVISALFCNDGACTPIEKQMNIDISKSDIERVNSDYINKYYKEIEVQYLNSENNENSKIVSEFSPIEVNAENISNIITAILFGLLAGLILNIMPCVLPVISLKIFTFVKNANEDKRKIRISGIFYSLGIILSFIILAALLSFAGYNWGGLFQNTTFLKIMILLLFAFSLSFLGVYTLNIPGFASKGSSKRFKNIYIEAFFHGILATILATPCSGPFLGATLTWTLTQSIPIIFTIFIFIGIGMALPYFILSMNTALLKFIPKPGKWMINFEKIMGLLLIGAVIYFTGLLDEKNIKIILWSLFIIALAFWQYGIYGTPVSKKINRTISTVILLVLVILAYLLPNRIFLNKDFNSLERSSFSYDLLKSETVNNSVIVQFTADWCTNCKVIEKNIYQSEEFIKLQKEYGFKVLKADLDKDPGAQDLLKKLGSRSVPFAAVFYNSNFLKPYILRDLYDIENIETALKKAKQSIKNPEFEIETIEF